MASVDGMTVAALNRELDKMIVRIEVDPETSTILAYPRNGDPMDAGELVDSSIAVANAWPIGSIYMTVKPGGENPSIILGVGTWVRFGKGKTIVSLDEAQAEFDGLEESGGTKSVQLTAAQSGMPLHAHSFSGGTGGMSTGGDIGTVDTASSTSGGTRPLVRGGGQVSHVIADSLNHTHSFSGNTDGATADAAAAHTNLQPYIVAYIWKRTA